MAFLYTTQYTAVFQKEKEYEAILIATLWPIAAGEMFGGVPDR